MQEMQEARDEAIAATASAMKLAETQSSVALLGQSLTQSLDLDTLLQESAPIIRQLLPARRIVINLADKETGTFITKFVHGREIEGLPTGGVRVLRGSVTDHVMETRAPMVISDELRRPKSKESVSLKVLEEAGIRSGLVVPLVVGEDATGTIVWFDDDPDHFDDRDLDLAITISVQVAGALVNAELHDRTLRLEKEKVERSWLEYENKRLEAANEMSAVVISNVSHELRTPLTSVLAFADNLQKNRNGGLDERDLMQVRMIRHSGRQLDLLISDLLTMSRLKQGEFKMSYAEFSLADLFAEVINVMSSIAAVKDQAITAPENQESIVLNADRSRLYQVICNLVSNALKYSPEGSSVELEYQATDSDVSISVRDYGEGMSAEEQTEVFERFARLDNDVTRTQQGTGLGLHIVQSLVARHGGKIDVESYEGMGSVFKITIPLQPGKNDLDAAA
jgi:signal transduction histidine kinase